MTKQTPFALSVTAEGDTLRIAFSGSITEEAKPELTRLMAHPAQKVLLDLEHVSFINSCGVRDWSVFLKAFRVGRDAPSTGCRMNWCER